MRKSVKKSLQHISDRYQRVRPIFSCFFHAFSLFFRPNGSKWLPETLLRGPKQLTNTPKHAQRIWNHCQSMRKSEKKSLKHISDRYQRVRLIFSWFFHDFLVIFFFASFGFILPHFASFCFHKRSKNEQKRSDMLQICSESPRNVARTCCDTPRVPEKNLFFRRILTLQNVLITNLRPSLRPSLGPLSGAKNTSETLRNTPNGSETVANPWEKVWKSRYNTFRTVTSVSDRFFHVFSMLFHCFFAQMAPNGSLRPSWGAQNSSQTLLNTPNGSETIANPWEKVRKSP